MTGDARPGTPSLTAGTALATVAGLLVLSLVVPPVLATRVADARVARASADLRDIAQALRSLHVGAGDANPALVLAGPGRLPKASGSATGGWLSASRGSLTARPDPWGNAYLVRMGDRAQTSRAGAAGSSVGGFRSPEVIVSAGPNGVIETAFDQSAGDSSFGGDDVGSRLREP